MGVASDGSYGIQAGLIFSFPVTIDHNHSYTIVPNLPIDAFAREKLDATLQELVEERDSAEASCNE